MTGNVTRHGESLIALPREVVSMDGVPDTILFELVRPEEVQKPAFLPIWFQAIRPRLLILALCPCLATFVYGFRHQSIILPWVVVSAFFGAGFFQIAVNVLNDVEDHLRLIDLPG